MKYNTDLLSLEEVDGFRPSVRILGITCHSLKPKLDNFVGIIGLETHLRRHPLHRSHDPYQCLPRSSLYLTE